MRYAWWALLFVLGASVADAQIGSRGAVEVRRENDEIPTPPPEREPDETEVEAAEAGVEPDEVEVAPAEVHAEVQPQVHPEVQPAEVPAQGRADAQPAQVPAEAEGASAEAASVVGSSRPDDSQREDESRRSLDTSRAPTTVVVEREQPREADPILDEITELVDLFGRERSAGNLLGILLWFVFASVVTGGLRRVRERFPSEGLIPNLLALAHLGMRLVVIALALAFIVRALPPRLSLVMLLAFAGLAVAIGWSLRDVMPDLVASLVIAFERRIRRGVWVSGDGFAGHVERLGLRAALLYDTHGNRVMVPNREIVRAPVTAGVGEHARELEVEVRIDGPADEVRAALRDAVLTSPWVHPDARPVVLRDPADPTRWRVRGRLLEASFGARFEGELLERAEALLRKHA